ncbi:PQQ-dependent sugar dehydrogenase [Elongatibacter sediminis]|uniref:PQQ-dependent sugar dehydrogenase n=1 Tax=Elongatibacter sediminis TaxID=3119006 RepID=A0AAW9R6Y9_9GAMM
MSIRPVLGVLMLLVLGTAQAQPAGEVDRHRLHGAAGAFVADRVLSGLAPVGAIAFLPGGDALVAQRSAGVLSRVDLNEGQRRDLAGMPEMLRFSGSGLLDVALHPEFAETRWVYISYSEGEEYRSTVVLDRFRLDGDRVTELERVFTADAYSENPYHYGGRIGFLDGYLYLTVGDRQHRERAQDRSNHTGSVVRLHDDGRVPVDNPFAGESASGDRVPPRPEIWSYGHRNPQGFVVDAESVTLWVHEHGPRGGDELNTIERGANYGWPEISFGLEYDGGPIGKGITREEGMEQPVWVWVPSIAPSGMILYRGNAFAGWTGNLLIGAMGLTHLNRLVLEDGAVVLEERLARGVLGRIRSVAEGPEGAVYVGTDAGEVWRLLPN